MSLTIPLAELTGGAAPRVRVEADETGAMVADFGARVARIGQAMETDRLDREAVTARSRIQRDLGQLSLDMEGIGDPDALDQAWAERSSALRDEILGAVDPRNRARIETAYDEVADRHALRIGARAIEARNSAWRAGLDDQAAAYVSSAPGSDAATRQAGRDQLADSVAEGIRDGRLTPEQGADILRKAGQDGERAALMGRLDTDPDGALAGLEAGEYAGADPLYIEGAKSVARAKIASREAAAAAEAERAATQRQKEIGDRLHAVRDVARDGGVSSWEIEFLADPEVRSHPDYAEAEAAVALRGAMPQFAVLPPADQRALIAAEETKTVAEPWELRQRDAMREGAKASAAKWTADPIAQAGALKLGVPALADPAGDPGEFAKSLAARRGFGQSLKDRGYTQAPVYFSGEERATLARAVAPDADPETRAGLAQAVVSAFGKDAPRALAEIGGDGVFTHMGSLASAGGAPGLAAEAFRGQQAMADKLVALPSAAERREWADEALGDVLAGDAPTEARVLAAADAIYAARAPRSGDPDRDLYLASVQAALGQQETTRGAASGGVQELRGAATLLPIGVTAEAVEDALDRGDAADRLRAAGASGGEPLYAGQPLDGSTLGGLRLRAIGNDVYTLYVERRGRRFDVTDSTSGRPYVLRLSRFLGGGQ